MNTFQVRLDALLTHPNDFEIKPNISQIKTSFFLIKIETFRNW